MSYRTPTLPERQKLRQAGLPTDRDIRYYIEPNPVSKHWKTVDFELEWVRNEQELLRGSYWSDSGPEYSENRVDEFEEGDLDELAARLDALLEPESERFDGTLIEVTINLHALNQYLDERNYQKAQAA